MGASKNMTTKMLHDEFCGDCGSALNGEFYDTVYGERYCDMCYDEYLFSDSGKLEYLASLVRGEISTDLLDAETLGEIAMAWKKYKIHVSPEMLPVLEAKMRELNLL